MNPFTTEHPLNSQPSWFNAKEHPVLSFVGSVFVLALSLTPIVLVGLYHWVVNAEDGMTTPEPLSSSDLWGFLTIGSIVAFGLSLVISFLITLGYRLATRW